MVIGNGSIADRFIKYSQNNEFVIFASDHTNTQSDFFKNEEELVIKSIYENPDKFFVYISTSSIYDPIEAQTEYVSSRIQIEKRIVEKSNNYLIVRVPLVVGRQQEDKTLFNHLVFSVLKKDKMSIWNQASRNILDVDDLFFILDDILNEKKISNQIINIANPENIKVKDLLSKVEKFLGESCSYDSIDKGSSYQIDIEKIKPTLFKLGLTFSSDYIELLLKKYYSNLIKDRKKISIVVPTYYAEEGLGEFYNRTNKVLNLLQRQYHSEIIFVNDGSTDKTLPILIELSNKNKNVKVLNLSRNFGNQFAITAGIDKADCDALVIIDDDLQDPPEIILDLISVWESGYEVVYGVRRQRKSIGAVFSICTKIFYRLLDYLSDTKIPVDTGDFRLIDRKALNFLKMMREENRYFRGMVAWIGFKQFGLLYDRDARYAGESNFTIKKYFKFAFDGLTSFSEKPLYYSSLLGLLTTGLSLIFGILIIYNKIVNPEFTIRGWASLVTIALFFGGVQLLSVGIIGLYVGKIYREVKGRPIYIVESEYGFNVENCQKK